MGRTEVSRGPVVTGRAISAISRFALSAILIAFTAGTAFSQVKYQRVRSAEKNSLGGYDYYNSAGKKTGYSRLHRKNGYNYYDNEGNKVGSLKLKNKLKKTYTYYDSQGIRKGTLKRRASGIYYYKDRDSHNIVDSVPSVKGELGSLSPNVFQGD